MIPLRALCFHCALAPSLDIASANERASTARFFDNLRAFVLDTRKISPIIYIWYEGGWLSPPVVTAKRTVGG